MILRKSKITHFFWILLALLCVATAIVTSTSVATSIGLENNIYAIGGVSAGIIVVSLLFSSFSALFNKVKKQDGDSLSSFMEYVIVSLIVIISFMIRFIYLIYCKGMINGDITFYRHAVLYDFSDLYSISPASYVYGRIISTFCDLIGDHVVIGMYASILLQVVIILMMYYTVKTLVGKWAGFIAVIFYAMFPYNIVDITRVNAETLIAFFFMLSIMMIVYTANSGIFGKLEGSLGITTVLLTGLFSGMTAYFDRAGISLLIFGICIIHAYANKDSLATLSSKSIQTFLFIAGFIAGFFGTVILCVKDSGYGFSDAVINYVIGFSKIRINPMIATPAYGDIFAPILVICGMIWVFRLVRVERDLCSYYVMLPFIVAICSLLGITNQNYSGLVTMLWCILSGIGISSIGRNSLEYYEKQKKDKEEAERKKQEDIAQLKKELEEKKASLAAKNREKTVSTLSQNTTTTSNPSLKELEATLDFLKQPETAEVKLKSDIKNDANNTSTNSATAENKEKDAASSGDLLIESVIDDTMKANADAARPQPIEAKVLPSSDGDNGVVNGITPVEQVVAPTNQMQRSIPVQKFGRRMDYKTAVVSSRSHLDLSANGGASSTVKSVGDSSPLPVNTVNVAESSTNNLADKPADNTATTLAAKSETSNQMTNTVKKSEPIHNPLPTPKKHVAKDMDFDYIPDQKDMHFDIVDMTGKDFFEIN